MALAAACTPSTPGPPSMTFALPAPGQTEPAFEPHLSIDRSNPDRILIAAHYGVGYNRGGERIWTWHSSDGGRSWTGADMPLPSATASLAADAVTGFDANGRGYLTFLFADTAGRRFAGGAALAVTAAGTLDPGPARVIAKGGLGEGGAIDKGWLAIDRKPTSPLYGAVYLSWHRMVPDFDRGTVSATFWIARSQDGGRTFSEPGLGAKAFSGQIAVRSSGTLDAIYAPEGQPLILHVASDDGGQTFSPPDTVARLAAGSDGSPAPGALDVPHLMTYRDSLLACWSSARGADSTRYEAHCSTSADGVRWEAPVATIPDLGPSQSFGFPITAASRSGWWLLGYLGDSSVTRVMLYRSTDGGRTWKEFRELARRALGTDRLCLAAGAPCRKAPLGTVFFPGDYFGLDAADDRVAAAYVLPVDDRPDGLATVYVSLVAP